MSAMRINFEDTFTDRFTEGTHEISIVSTDADGRMSSVVLSTCVVSSAVVVTEPPYPADVWSSMATLRGTLVKDASEAYFRYREAGTSEWTEVSATLTGKSMTAASISGLVAGTQYEYVAVANGIASAIVETFTTEEALQLPNGDFEMDNINTCPYCSRRGFNVLGFRKPWLGNIEQERDESRYELPPWRQLLGKAVFPVCRVRQARQVRRRKPFHWKIPKDRWYGRCAWLGAPFLCRVPRPCMDM